ncbi:MAG: RNA polymerase sigma factor [Gemmatimonadota bacterium]
MTDPKARELRDPAPGTVERARAGDRAALEEVLTSVHPVVYRWALARTGDPSRADDLAQEALIRVIRRIGSFRGDARFTSWLYRIVANVATDQVRRERRRETREEALEMLEKTASHPPDPERALDRARLLDRVRRSFLGLTERQREIFDLAELQGFEAAEVGEMLGVAPSTVRVTLLRARRTLREEILRTDPELVEAFFS